MATYTYKYCDGNTTKEVTVTLTVGSNGCNYNVHSGTYENGCTYDSKSSELTATLSETITESIKIYYTYDWVQDEMIDNHSYHDEGTGQSYIIIPAGTTTAIKHDECYYYEECDQTNQGGDEDPVLREVDKNTTTITHDNYELAPQPSIPICDDNSSCSIDITSYVTTPPTNRGANDGIIEINVSGATNTTVTYKINGYVDSQDDTDVTYHKYTGLTGAEVYTILVEDGNCFTQKDIFLEEGDFRTGDFDVFEPSILTASENPILLTLRTAINNHSPQSALIKFTINDQINNDDTITIDLEYPTVYSVTFTAKDYPDNNTYFLTTVLRNEDGDLVGSNTVEEIAVSLAQVLQKDPNISRYYSVKVDGADVYMISYEMNNNLSLIEDFNLFINSNGITVYTEQGVTQYDGQLVANYNLYTDIYVNDADELGDPDDPLHYKLGSSLVLPYSQDNIHKFDLSGILKSYLKIPKINFNMSGSTVIPDVAVSYYVDYGEMYPLIKNSNTLKKRQKGQTDVKWVLNAALPYTYANDLTNYLPTGATVQRRFLTNSPNPKLVQRYSNEYLYFALRKDHNSPVKLYGDIYFYDGSETLDVELTTIIPGTTNIGGVYLIPAGYNNLNLSFYEDTGKKIRTLKLKVKDDIGNQLSDIKEYRYNIDDMPRKFGVAFLNQLGMYDIFDFKGETVSTITRSTSKYETPREIQYNGASPRGFISNGYSTVDNVKTYTVNTGWIDREHFDWLIEMLSSTRIYCYTLNHQPYLLVTTVDYKGSSNDDMFSITITFTETTSENNVKL